MTACRVSPKALVDSVARVGTRDALNKLKDFVDSSNEDLREAAVDAMWVFHSDPVLSREAIDFLYKRTNSGNEEVRWDVIFGLMKFGAEAYDELELVVRKNKALPPYAPAWSCRAPVSRTPVVPAVTVTK